MAISHKNRQRILIALVQTLGLTVWFSASAVVPTLQREWEIDSAAAVWLTASVQVGFVVGAVGSVILTLADRCRSHLLMAWGTAGAACSTAILSFFVDSLGPAIVLRFLTGVFLAGVYPVGMKLMASWSEPAGRGKAFGVLLGALTLGSAMPHLISGLGDLPWRHVMATAAGISLTGALVAAFAIRSGPYAAKSPGKLNPRYALTMFREQGPRLINIGYFGHMWELYALWTWLPIFVIASQQGAGVPANQLSAGLFIAVGIAGVGGSLLGGWAADRWDRPRTAMVALVVSGSCCLLSPVLFVAGWVPLLVFLLIWGASVIADSGVFSTSLSEIADQRYVGTALTAQTAFGFLLTVITIQFVPIFAAFVGWQYAFLLLLPGPLVGVLAMETLRRAQSHEERKAHNATR